MKESKFKMKLPDTKEKLLKKKQKLSETITEINKVLRKLEIEEHKKECVRCKGTMSYYDRGIYDSDSGYVDCHHVMLTWNGHQGEYKQSPVSKIKRKPRKQKTVDTQIIQKKAAIL